MTNQANDQMKHKNIHEAILGVMNEVGYVQKDGQIRSGGSYRFASESAFIQALRPAMLEHGIYVYPSKCIEPSLETYTTSSGTNMNLVLLTMQYTFVYAGTGESITVEVMGSGSDVGDKASNKALTAAFKYALRQAFMIETGDDPDQQASVEQERATPKTTNKASANAWAKEKIDLVIQNTPIEETKMAVAFLEHSGFQPNAAEGAITALCQVYAVKIDEGLTQKEALDYAKKHWQEELGK